MPEISQGVNCNSPMLDTSSVGQPSPVPPIASESPAKRARKAAKAARKAIKKARRSNASLEFNAPDMDGAAHRSLSPGTQRKDQELAERNEKEAAECMQIEDAAAADNYRKHLEERAEADRERERQALDASIQELVAKRQALSIRSNTSPSSSRAHGGNPVVHVPIQHQEGKGFLLYVLIHNDVTNSSTGIRIWEDTNGRGGGLCEVQCIQSPYHTNKGGSIPQQNGNLRCNSGRRV